jgi:DNA mismatch repair protein MutS2
MDSHTLSLLGFERIQQLVASKTQTVFGDELANKIQPLSSQSTIEYEFDLIDESLSISDEISLYEISDLRPYLLDISSDTVLTPQILIEAKKALEAIRKTKEFFLKRKESVPKLYQLIKDIATNEPLESAINRAIDEFGEIKSDASSKLKKIRSEITKKRNEIIKKLELFATEKSEYLQDSTFSIRHNRYCLPLKVEYQKKIPAILHEFSPTAKTVFIEPLTLVDTQNEFAHLIDEEKNEIHRILSALSRELFTIRDEILSTFSVISKLDVVFAKRRFAIQFNCTRPRFSNDGIIRIIKGVHPLLALAKKDIVPLNLIFPEHTNVILISGPNAGGKTVVMKTVGLFTLMFLSGIPIPASQGTEIPFFQKVYADIGDDQSLDSNLSSFTAHLLKVKEILQNAGIDSLVLLDEIGSSTSPEEGSALAMAVLENLRDKGCYCLATSHLNPLKAFVNDAPKMINAAMEFTNQPTYHFTIGFPGTSSALEISQNLGFPEQLLQRAKDFLDQDWLKLTERLKSLSSETEKTKQLNEQLAKEKTELEKWKTDYESRLKKFKTLESEEKQKILIESRRFLFEQRRNIENIVRNIKETNAEKNAIIKAKKYIDEQLSNMDTVHTQQESTPTTLINQMELFDVGDVVFSKTFQKNGLVIEKNYKSVTVAFGSIKFELDYDDLHKVTNKNDEPQLSPTQNYKQDYQQPIFQPTLNIIGQTKEEATVSIQRFLSDALINQIYELSIIHGKGKGILKDMLWETLGRDNRVEQLRFGEPFEGGLGMTKVILKK